MPKGSFAVSLVTARDSILQFVFLICFFLFFFHYNLCLTTTSSATTTLWKPVTSGVNKPFYHRQAFQNCERVFFNVCNFPKPSRKILKAFEQKTESDVW